MTAGRLNSVDELPPGAGEADAADAPVSVLHQVYGAFADALGAQEGYKEVAERLRQALIKDGGRSEAALRTALFGSDRP